MNWTQTSFNGAELKSKTKLIRQKDSWNHWLFPQLISLSKTLFSLGFHASAFLFLLFNSPEFLFASFTSLSLFLFATSKFSEACLSWGEQAMLIKVGSAYFTAVLTSRGSQLLHLYWLFSNPCSQVRPLFAGPGHPVSADTSAQGMLTDFTSHPLHSSAWPCCPTACITVPPTWNISSLSSSASWLQILLMLYLQHLLCQ